MHSKNQKYTYFQFKVAAKKHFRTCMCLSKQCEKDWAIKENIVYLSGYVVEFMLKYKFFRNINYNPREDIKKLNLNNKITYRKDIEKHKIRELINLVRKYEGTLILDKLEKYFGNWEANIRYNGKKKEYNNLEELVDLCRELIEKFGG